MGAVVTFHIRLQTAAATKLAWHAQHFADVMVFMDSALIHIQQLLIVIGDEMDIESEEQ